MNRHYSFLYAAGLLIAGTAVCFAGSLSMTTYYPSPTGYFDNLFANNVGINTTSTAYQLNIRGWLAWGPTTPSSILASDQGGSIELGAAPGQPNPVTGGIPYIDFHYGNGTAQDYNARIINDGDNSLLLQSAGGGMVNIKGATVGINNTDPSLAGTVSSAFTITTGASPTGLAIANAGGGRFALNPMGAGGGWTMYDSAGGGVWNAGLMQMGGKVGIRAGNPEADLVVDNSTFGLNLYGSWPNVGFNSKYTGGTWRYQNNGYAGLISGDQNVGGLAFYTAPAGTAGNATAWNNPLYLAPTGNVGIKTTSAPHTLTVNGSIQSSVRIGTTAFCGGQCDPDSGYPGGWGGGVHTWDVYAEGTVGVGSGGSLNAYMNSSGNMFSKTSILFDDQASPPRQLYLSKDGVIWRPDSSADRTLYLNTWSAAGGAVMVGDTGKFVAGTQNNDLYVGGATRSFGGYFYTSDIRLKENVRPLTGALDMVSRLNGVRFTWKGNKREDIGFVAQNVEKVLPELVSEDNRGMKSVEYGNLTALLIEAVKEQQKQIDTLKKQLAELSRKK